MSADPIHALNKELDAKGYVLKDRKGESIPEFYATRATRQLAVTAKLASELGVTLQHQPVISIQQPAPQPVTTAQRAVPLSRWGRIRARRVLKDRG